MSPDPEGGRGGGGGDIIKSCLFRLLFAVSELPSLKSHDSHMPVSSFAV